MKNIVFITSGMYPWNNGRCIASNGYAREFSKYANVKVFSTLAAGVPISEAYSAVDKELNIDFCQEKLSKMRRMLSYPHQRMLFKWIGTFEPINTAMYRAVVLNLRNNKVDVVIFDHLALANYFIAIKKMFPKLVYVYNSHNAECVNYYQQLTRKEYNTSGKKELEFDSWISKLKFCLYSKIEERILREANYSVAISKCDLEIISSIYNIDKKKLLLTRPLTRFTLVKKFEDMKDFKNNLLIVGSMGWYPNVRGILWFIENVFDEIIKKTPGYKLYIVGRGPAPELCEICAKYPQNIVLTGEVESTEPYFEMCDISIVPVFEGTGIKIKVIESMSRGIPTICSEFAAKDYDVDDEIAVASDKQEFIDHIYNIAASREVRENYYKHMEEYCKSYYDLTDDMKKLFGVK